jgi:hypothetical protein
MNLGTGGGALKFAKATADKQAGQSRRFALVVRRSSHRDEGGCTRPNYSDGNLACSRALSLALKEE